MSDFTTFNRESRAEREARKQRIQALTQGARGTDGLTDAERLLLATLRRQGLEIRRGWLMNERDGKPYPHERIVEQVGY